MVSAASVDAPDKIANDVAIILPNCIFGGPAAPMATKPMEISSRLAPSVTPALKSPRTRPASVLKINGLPIF